MSLVSQSFGGLVFPLPGRGMLGFQVIWRAGVSFYLGVVDVSLLSQLFGGLVSLL